MRRPGSATEDLPPGMKGQRSSGVYRKCVDLSVHALSDALILAQTLARGLSIYKINVEAATVGIHFIDFSVPAIVNGVPPPPS